MMESGQHPRYNINVIYNHARSRLSATEDTKLSQKFTELLIKKVESWGYMRTYYHDRDALPGKNMFSELFRVIKDSEYTIVILTKGFKNNCWSKYCQLAAFKTLLDNEASDQLIPIVVGLEDKEIPQNLNIDNIIYFDTGDWFEDTKENGEQWLRLKSCLLEHDTKKKKNLEKNSVQETETPKRTDQAELHSLLRKEKLTYGQDCSLSSGPNVFSQNNSLDQDGPLSTIRGTGDGQEISPIISPTASYSDEETSLKQFDMATVNGSITQARGSATGNIDLSRSATENGPTRLAGNGKTTNRLPQHTNGNTQQRAPAVSEGNLSGPRADYTDVSSTNRWSQKTSANTQVKVPAAVRGASPSSTLDRNPIQHFPVQPTNNNKSTSSAIPKAGSRVNVGTGSGPADCSEQDGSMDFSDLSYDNGSMGNRSNKTITNTGLPTGTEPNIEARNMRNYSNLGAVPPSTQAAPTIPTSTNSNVSSSLIHNNSSNLAHSKVINPAMGSSALKTNENSVTSGYGVKTQNSDRLKHAQTASNYHMPSNVSVSKGNIERKVSNVQENSSAVDTGKVHVVENQNTVENVIAQNCDKFVDDQYERMDSGLGSQNLDMDSLLNDNQLGSGTEHLKNLKVDEQDAVVTDVLEKTENTLEDSNPTPGELNSTVEETDQPRSIFHRVGQMVSRPLLRMLSSPDQIFLG